MNFFLSLISGLLTGLAFPFTINNIPFTEMGPLAWVSISFFYIALKNSQGKNSIFHALIFCFGFFGIVTYPGFAALYETGQLNFWPYLINFLILTSLISLIFCLFIWAAVKANCPKVPLWVTLPLAWVSFDLIRHYIPFGGIPWASLAYSQSKISLLYQILDITGIHGITFLLVLANCLLGELWLFLRRKSSFPTKLLITFLILMSSTLLYGKLRLDQVNRILQTAPEKIKVAIIQGNLPPNENWSPQRMQEVTRWYLFMSEGLEGQHPDLIVWPETPQPIGVPTRDSSIPAYANLKTPLLLGMLTYEGPKPLQWPPKPGDIKKGFKLYNSAVLVMPGGGVAGFYHKNHLAPFGEYAPWGLGFRTTRNIVMAATDFTPGRDWNTLKLPQESQHPILLGVMICFEDLFPEISRSLTQNGANLLLNLTNVAWFGRSSAIYQHLVYSQFRAVENRRSLVRATNSGISAFFLPSGEVISSPAPFEQGLGVEEVPLLSVTSLFTRVGNLFGYLALAGLILSLIYSLRRGTPPKVG